MRRSGAMKRLNVLLSASPAWVLKNFSWSVSCASMSIASILPRNSRARTLTWTRKLEREATHRALSNESPHRFECCFDAERLQHAQDLVTDRCVDAQAADRNAARGTVVRTSTVAIVAADLAAVVYMELAAAVAASQQSGQQQLAFTSCSASECAAHAGRIVGDYLQV